MIRRLPALSVVLAILALTIGCDQSAKAMARRSLPGSGVHRVLDGYLLFVYAENPGAFLSLGATWPDAVRHAVFTFLCLALLAGLLLWVLTAKRLHLSTTIGLALLAGGGIGNLIDRVFRSGLVTDFINIGIGPVRTGIFNLADFFILAGGLLLLAAELVRRRSARQPSG